MKKLLKLIFWLLIAALTAHSLTSCKKDEAEPPMQTWYLDVKIPSFGYSQVLPANSIRANIGADGSRIGDCIQFKDALLTATLFEAGGGKIQQMTGTWRGHPYLLVDDSLNICQGAQRVPITLNLKFQ